MNRHARLLLSYFVLSIAAVPLNMLLAFPRYPSPPLGWVPFAAFPVPLALAGEWLFQYRPWKLFRTIDAWARRIEESPSRLAIIVGLVAAAGVVGLIVVLLVTSTA